MVNKLTVNVPAGRRSVLRRLEDLLPEIEQGLAAGYTHADMHAALPSLGINVGLPYYYRALHKLRKERREGTACPVPAPVARTEILKPDKQDAALPSPNKGDFSGALTPSPASTVATIVGEQSGPKKFRWSAKEFLAIDWENF